MKVILLIGKIATGKTTYAKTLGGMLISCDQLMQSMSPFSIRLLMLLARNSFTKSSPVMPHAFMA